MKGGLEADGDGVIENALNGVGASALMVRASARALGEAAGSDSAASVEAGGFFVLGAGLGIG